MAGMDGVRYRVGELTLNAGDRLFLYTDGVTEATNTQNQLYGEDRLLNFMNNNPNLEAQELLTQIKGDIDNFVGEAPQFDDITMLTFEYKHKKGGEQMTNKVFPAKTQALSDVLAFVEQNLENWECSIKAQMSICVAIEEVFVNVAHYAYEGEDGQVEFAMGFDPTTRNVTFKLIDSGVQFDPLQKPDPDVTLSASERNIGGLGIFITKKTMDTLTYDYVDGKNVLTMTKKI